MIQVNLFFYTENTEVDASTFSKILKKTFSNDKKDKTSHSNTKASKQNLNNDYFTALEYDMSKPCMGHALIVNNEHFNGLLLFVY